jgi:pectate lyase
MPIQVSRRGFLRHSAFGACGLLLSPFVTGLAAGQTTLTSSDTGADRLRAVQAFADQVLERGRDRWSGHRTPLFADGLNVDTGEPVEWRFDGRAYPLSNLASQQNLFRTLDTLSHLTGQPRYRQAAMDAFHYHFEQLTSPCGLLRWGGHQFINLATLEPVGHFDANCHELKNSFPYMELMWRVNPEATTRYVRAFWNAHILDWQQLDMNRHGAYGRTLGKLWAHPFEPPEPLFTGRGLTFINTGTDLIYAGAMLHGFSGEHGPIEWAERLAHQYVRARHPRTGLGVYQYSQPIRQRQPPEVLTEPAHTWSSYGDRAQNQFGRWFGDVAREAYVLWGGRTESIYGRNAVVQLHLAERLGDQGANLLRWTVDGLKAYAHHAYEPEKNRFRPMWADGTDMTGYVFPQFGYYGPKGTTVGPVRGSTAFLIAYARAFRLTGDPALWKTVRSLARGNDLGDLGTRPGRDPAPQLGTGHADPEAVFAVLEVHRAQPHPAYLELARSLADRLVDRHFYRGFFLPSRQHLNANFNAEEPLAILAVEAALRGAGEEVPAYVGSRGYVHGRFDGRGRTTDHAAIWGVRRPSTPAAAAPASRTSA